MHAAPFESLIRRGSVDATVFEANGENLPRLAAGATVLLAKLMPPGTARGHTRSARRGLANSPPSPASVNIPASPPRDDSAALSARELSVITALRRDCYNHIGDQLSGEQFTRANYIRRIS